MTETGQPSHYQGGQSLVHSGVQPASQDCRNKNLLLSSEGGTRAQAERGLLAHGWQLRISVETDQGM